MHLHLNFSGVRFPTPDSGLQPAKLCSAHVPMPDSCLPAGPDFRNTASFGDASGIDQASYGFPEKSS